MNYRKALIKYIGSLFLLKYLKSFNISNFTYIIIQSQYFIIQASSRNANKQKSVSVIIGVRDLVGASGLVSGVVVAAALSSPSGMPGSLYPVVPLFQIVDECSKKVCCVMWVN